MNIIDALFQRKSIRGYLQKPVSAEVIEKILDAAVRAPSGENIQPWEFTVITGDILDTIRGENEALLRAGTPPDAGHEFITYPEGSIYRRRRMEMGKELFRLMEIPRGDAAIRLNWTVRGFRYFEAPVALIVSYDSTLPDKHVFIDIGCVVQSICLAALEFGLATCIAEQGVVYSAPLRRHAALGEGKIPVIAVALGYPDEKYPANKLETKRDAAKAVTTWAGF